MNVLVLNSGSSSIKAAVFDRHGQALHRSVRDLSVAAADPDHGAALDDLLLEMETAGRAAPFAAVAHRVVHGGSRFTGATRLDAAALDELHEISTLAPLHNNRNLAGIEAARQRFAGVPQFAVFDTAFHHTLPEHVRRYALPDDLDTPEPIRRYGFHGLSHAWVARVAARLLQRPLDRTHLITLHLGSGASVTAIERGRSVDTSMGWTPLEGLMMSTRCGDLDPAIPLHLQRQCNLSAEEVEELLNHRGGLAGICGDGDMRRVHERADQGDATAQLALDMYWHRIRKYVGAYCAVLGHVDALVFTGGIGENDARTRAAVCRGLEGLGFRLDVARNDRRDESARAIHAQGSGAAIFVVPTDEEAEIARQVLDSLLGGEESSG